MSFVMTGITVKFNLNEENVNGNEADIFRFKYFLK